MSNFFYYVTHGNAKPARNNNGVPPQVQDLYVTPTQMPTYAPGLAEGHVEVQAESPGIARAQGAKYTCQKCGAATRSSKLVCSTCVQAARTRRANGHAEPVPRSPARESVPALQVPYGQEAGQSPGYAAEQSQGYFQPVYAPVPEPEHAAPAPYQQVVYEPQEVIRSHSGPQTPAGEPPGHRSRQAKYVCRKCGNATRSSKGVCSTCCAARKGGPMFVPQYVS
ncbi:uncharacterized protein L969DRAFT_87704 [Mixia osmundae IAM 14324]|uniref:Uncharacterized protein n=1 Tax=Mixia osmundae (strain CBS 9802 / IAM 14324 / JCM 22182 / KY 12970) TaxID=764103 RepID=G7E447_MIXOS|nr:uncharacterized protein L969DRAFT_87704 [Mixia osmundae IAM 14324]KEI39702.1 hypothetical protein L969DRAFT_87704 [Mixia osmundae IAM 14324]GAA97607.1 hypothetical protein E5Q_04285 [Mixia osmundae IAM 14324]